MTYLLISKQHLEQYIILLYNTTISNNVHLRDKARVLLKVVNPNVDVNVDVDVTFVNFAFY